MASARRTTGEYLCSPRRMAAAGTMSAVLEYIAKRGKRTVK